MQKSKEKLHINRVILVVCIICERKCSFGNKILLFIKCTGTDISSKNCYDQIKIFFSYDVYLRLYLEGLIGLL